MATSEELPEKRDSTDSTPQLVETRKISRVRKLKVSCMSEAELSGYPGVEGERKTRRRTSAPKSKYRSHYVKKTVKDTFKNLPQSPEEQAEVLSKLAEQVLLKLQSSGRELMRTQDAEA